MQSLQASINALSDVTAAEPHVVHVLACAHGEATLGGQDKLVSGLSVKEAATGYHTTKNTSIFAGKPGQEVVGDNKTECCFCKMNNRPMKCGLYMGAKRFFETGKIVPIFPLA